MKKLVLFVAACALMVCSCHKITGTEGGGNGVEVEITDPDAGNTPTVPTKKVVLPVKISIWEGMYEDTFEYDKYCRISKYHDGNLNKTYDFTFNGSTVTVGLTSSTCKTYRLRGGYIEGYNGPNYTFYYENGCLTLCEHYRGGSYDESRYDVCVWENSNLIFTGIQHDDTPIYSYHEYTYGKTENPYYGTNFDPIMYWENPYYCVDLDCLCFTGLMGKNSKLLPTSVKYVNLDFEVTEIYNFQYKIADGGISKMTVTNASGDIEAIYEFTNQQIN